MMDPQRLSLTDDELLAGERAALDAFFDLGNARKLAVTLWALVVTMAIYAMVLFGKGSPILGAIAGLAVISDLLLLRQRSSPAVTQNIRQTIAAVLIGHLVVLQLFHPSASGAIGFWFVLFAVAAARYRLASGETVALFVALFAVAMVRMVGQSLVMRQSPPFLSLALLAVFFTLCFTVSWALSRRKEATFLDRWRAEADRQRDRLRMKQELEYAREIQLSMLPRSAPEIDWLDVAALSLPATEVGGDYYDYFELEDNRLALVVGDVTGHGVASGLVLSGVRSSLNLLRDEMGTPSAVLERVNLMLKRTSTPRMNMTLAVVVLDHIDRSALIATAGHPPVLIRRSRGGVDEVGSGAFPLGAIGNATYRHNRVELTAGDVLVVYSDGLVEALNENGEQFGWGRLSSILAELDGTESAKEIRDRLLRELWDFKGNAEQVDDVTMVIARWTPS